MMLYFWIFLGAGLGGVARFAVSAAVAQQWGESFPLGTLIVNVSGSFVIGFFATLVSPEGLFSANTTARHFVTTGILGGYTTYSAFSLQTLNLMRGGQWVYAGTYVGGTLVLCFAAVLLGHVCALALGGSRA